MHNKSDPTYRPINRRDIEPFPLLSVQNIDFPLLELKKESLGSTCTTTTSKKRTRQDIIPPNPVAISQQDGLTKEEELLYTIRIDPKNRETWLWICSCIKHNNITGKYWYPPPVPTGPPPVLTGTNCANSGTEGVKRKYPTH